MILNKTPILSSPERHLVTKIHQNPAQNRSTAEENTHSPLPLRIPLKELHHLFIVRVENGLEIRATEVCRRDEACERGGGLFRGAVLLQQGVEDVRRKVFAFGGEVVVQPDVEVGVAVGGGDAVEEGGEPVQVGLVAHDPVEVDAAVDVEVIGLPGIGGEGREVSVGIGCCAGSAGEGDWTIFASEGGGAGIA